MKRIFKITALFAAILMIFCLTGCGDNAGGTPSEQQYVAQETPLTLEAIAAGTITLTNPWSTLKYKKNGGDFVSVTASANTIAVAAGDKVAFYADGSENTYDSNTTTVTALRISCNSDCYVYGNVMSLLSSSDFKNATSISTEYAFAELFYYFDDSAHIYTNTHIKNHAQKALVLPAATLADRCYNGMFCGCKGLTSAPALPATTLADGCYQSMFIDCTGLTSAPALPATSLAAYCYFFMFYGCTGLTSAPALPATTLATSCYYGMLWNCTGLTNAPALPATTLANGCYNSMFHGCTGLTNAPALPATTLAYYCYEYMFTNCTSLTSSPVLPATTLAVNCYYEMFKGCSNLSSVTCLATNISASGCTNDWLSGVASTGTFNKAASMNDWPSGASGIPSGWTVQNYSAQ
jgi:hypothetical protein